MTVNAVRLAYADAPPFLKLSVASVFFRFHSVGYYLIKDAGIHSEGYNL